MFKSMNKLMVRAIIEFVMLATILSLAGYFVYYKMDLNLKESLEETVALQSKSIAFGLEQQFNEQFKKLRAASSVIESGQITPDNLKNFFMVGSIDEKMGMISQHGKLISGDRFNYDILRDFKDVFDGREVVKYRQNGGLIFAVPVKINDQICMIFNSHSDESVRKKFQAISYNGSGTIILQNGMDNWMILSEGEELINLDPEMQAGWNKLINKLNSVEEDYSSVYYKFHDKSYFVYFAEVSKDQHIAISGYAPWRAVAVGIDYIYMVMVVTLFIILLMILFEVRYMMKKREAEELAHDKIIADSANKAKSEFLSNMSHEIRTPINAIMGMDEMIIRESRDKNILEYAENLQNAARNLLGLVNDILDFSKIEAGKMEIIPVEYALSSMLNDLINMIQKRAEKKNLTFQINASPDIPSILFGDEIRIKQVITNILTNAVKYTEKGGVTLNVTSRQADLENIYLCISVSDTGIGIKKEDLSKLFSAFERIEEKRNRTIEGTGLGMNITQRLLAMMNTKLEVESEYGKGSTFSFKIEQKVVDPEPLGDFQENYKRSISQHEEYHESFTAPDAKILVVDDTVMNLTVIKGLLKQTKIQIDTATNGPDCLAIVAKKRYDIIFLDHRMPGMDGIETLHIMQKMMNNPNAYTPIISLTANAISGSREKYIEAGFSDYLTKPVNGLQLENLIREYLPRKKIIVSDFQIQEEISEEKFSLPEWLYHVDGLNIAEGIDHCGDIELYLDALTVFAESVLSASELIENYYKSGDIKNYITKVHALKSSARVIGADELSEKARRLEEAGNAGYITEIKNDTEPLLKLYRSYADKLSPLIKSDEDDEDPNKILITDYDLKEAFEAMKDAVATFDYDTMNFVFQSLDEYRLPKFEAEVYKKIKEAAANLDWEEIKRLLDGVLK